MGSHAKDSGRRRYLVGRSTIMHTQKGNKMIDASRVKQLTQKLETQGDITLEEADELYFSIKSLWKVMLEPTFQSKFRELPLVNFKNWLALENWYKKWYEAVARKVEAGQSGNFIFSILFVYEPPSFHDRMKALYETLKKYGKPEDRIMAIWTNEKAFSLFPKCLANLFRWDEYEQMYALQSERAGFLRYPHVENGKVYTLWQFLHEASLSPLLTLPGDFAFLTSSSLFANASTIPFALEYLKRKTCYMTIAEVNTSDEDRTTVFVDKKHLSMARIALSVPFEDIVKNALAQKIVDRDLVKELLNSDKETEWFLDINLINAGIKYIEEAVKIKMEWEATQEEVEESNEWLEEIR